MHCPSCNRDRTKVIDSRPAEGGVAVRRRRACLTCEHRFTTYERLEPNLMVRKRSGELEPFQRSKLEAGISSALADRPVSGRDATALVDGLEDSLASFGSVVTSEEIGKAVLGTLRDVDEVAYLRFASVYKEFQDAADFEREMAALESVTD